ncbi:hypothetical protein BDY19DRAFT_157855 [Irpex rosettiformis]|uniref:Uncharacterized protein n=1 Tax=Irpex rosettiformis TaxID=378272 RepID=A0ACB8U3T4_9APHY|nr:hypothetical protein BDY19DRAFT_157855 [Irpex rosettiformis]
MLSDDDDENSAILPSVQPDAFPDSNEEDDLTGFQSRRSQWANRIDSSENESSPSEGASRDRGLSNEAQNIIQETYRAVWTEFYEWEPSHSSQTLRSLASESHSRPAASDYGLEDLDWCIETGQVVYGGLDTDAEQFDVWQWTDEGTAQHLVTLPTETIISEEAVIPHPSYEACTPCHSNIDGGTDGSKPHCKFIKYAGQPGFDERGYLRLFRFIEWQQQPWRDPDHLIIAFTTIQRLTALSGNGIAPSIPIYVDDIDDSQIFYQYQGSISNYTDDPFPVVEITFSMRGR